MNTDYSSIRKIRTLILTRQNSKLASSYPAPCSGALAGPSLSPAALSSNGLPSTAHKRYHHHTWVIRARGGFWGSLALFTRYPQSSHNTQSDHQSPVALCEPELNATMTCSLISHYRIPGQYQDGPHLSACPSATTMQVRRAGRSTVRYGEAFSVSDLKFEDPPKRSAGGGVA